MNPKLNLCNFFFFALQGTYLDTILPREDLPENKESMPEIGQRLRLSKGDIAQTMALYSCPGNNSSERHGSLRNLVPSENAC